jgi:signal peptidase I
MMRSALTQFLQSKADPPKQGWRRLIPRPKQAIAAFPIAGALLFLNNVFVFESVVVPTSSMSPTILPNERVILERFPRRPIQRFDIVVVNNQKLGRRLAKRVVGLPGERVRVEQSWRLFINDVCVDYSPENTSHVRTEANHHPIQILDRPNSTPAIASSDNVLLGPDEYYLLGDNRLPAATAASSVP